MNKLKQHPILSGIIAIAGLTMLIALVLLDGTMASVAVVYSLWWGIMGLTVLISITARAILYFHNGKSRRWQMVLLTALWILVVGAGTCGSSAVLLPLITLFFS